MGFAYSNDGLSYRHVEADWPLAAGETYFAEEPTPDAIDAAFPGHAVAALAAAAPGQYAQLVAGGLSVTSTGSPALSGVYATDQNAEFNITALQTAILTNASLWGGYYRLRSGARVTMTAEQFTAIATAIFAFVQACDAALENALLGETPSWPETAVTIA